MKPAFAAVLLAALAAACSNERMVYKEMPAPTRDKAPVIDVAPKDIPLHMGMRAPLLKKRIAIARLDDTGWIPKLTLRRDDGLIGKFGGTARLAEILIDRLHKSGRFDIVERKEIDTLIREIRFGETAYVDKTTAARAGNMLGAQCLLLASAGKNDSEATRDFQPIAVFLRLVDVSTSRIIGSEVGVGADLQEAAAQAVDGLVKTSEKTPWVGRILRIDKEGDKTRFVVDSGRDLGLEPGDVFAVFTLGEPVKDPENDRILGYPEKGAGLVRIVTVQDRISLAEPVQVTAEINAGDLIRPAIDKPEE